MISCKAVAQMFSQNNGFKKKVRMDKMTFGGC